MGRRRRATTKPMPQVLLTSWWKGEKRYWFHPPSVAAATYGEAGPPSSRSRGASAFAQGSGGQVGEAGIAIDRFDGSIVGQQLEEVTE